MLRTIFLVFAFIGWGVSLYIHYNAAVEHININTGTPYTIVMHLGAMLALASAFLFLRKRKDFNINELQNSKVSRLDILKKLFKHTPIWLKGLATICFIYAIINFASTILGGDFFEGNTKNTTEGMGYLKMKMFSGHWMALYIISAALLYPFGIEKEQTYS